MQVHKDFGLLPVFHRAVVTIGTFDGVHRGHRHIIAQLREHAAACAGESIIITFDPHPREVVQSTRKPIHLLNTLDEKICLLEQAGIDHLVVVPFTPAFAALSATAYIEEFLVARFHPHTIIIGYDHRFGRNREGGLELLEAAQHRFGFELVEIPQQVVHDITISSTRIRQHLEKGQIQLANELLGYQYFLTGQVVHGDKRGRQLGFPTANIQINDPRKLIPASGVYAVKVGMGQPRTTGFAKVYNGVMNIGYQPTFNGKDLRVEVNIFDFEETLYGSAITVFFVDFIREDRKFESVAALVQQMHQDKATAQQILQVV